VRAGALVVGAALHAGCAGAFPAATIDVGDHTVRVEVAATPELRTRGLMHRDSLKPERGMLFMYPDETVRSFWMKNVPFPLDVAFADSSGKIVRIADMKAMDTRSTHSLYPARYALEMNRGWFETNEVEPGDYIRRIPDIEAK
jgi:uncharacterized membrane protein (UPF0127 family)